MQSTSKISSATITSLSDDVLTEILVRLPSLASLAHAALTCPRWRRVATSRDFLAGFRARHSSLPLLGCFYYGSDGYYVVPVFQRARNLPDSDLAAVVRGGDFLLSSFFEDDLWTLKDIWQGRLLFASDDELAVFNPVSRRRTCIPLPNASEFSEHDRQTSIDCLLPACGAAVDAAFRVVSLECDEQVRVCVHEYNSRTGEWRPQPWTPHGIINWSTEDSLRAMHAAGRIYWKHSGKLLCLETAPSGSVQFSHVALPPVPGLQEAAASYVVGDMEDGTCCLVCVAMSRHLQTRTLQVWLRREDGGGSWELGWETKSFSRLTHCAVNAGIVLFEGYRAYRLNEIDEFRFGGNLPTEASFFASPGSEAYPYVACSTVLLGRLMQDDGDEARQ